MNKHKILEVCARRSFMYILHPYILEIEYAKSSDPVYLGAGTHTHVMFPFSDHTTVYKWKYRHLAEMKNDICKLQDQLPSNLFKLEGFEEKK